ncbi:hypothetical protein ElyMa_005835300 [Elysia marginata]|uniref:Uncharacterized protein n=1 Tax=Elysia marginata TaxID=1093978 RepID=A0AAV4FX88_9GAST|nr:hypothetical protein ElyMa_005835300 [Elysia marginata]
MNVNDAPPNISHFILASSLFMFLSFLNKYEDMKKRKRSRLYEEFNELKYGVGPQGQETRVLIWYPPQPISGPTHCGPSDGLATPGQDYFIARDNQHELLLQQLVSLQHLLSSSNSSGFGEQKNAEKNI